MRSLSWMIATAFGIGHVPVASGTVASFVAAVAWYWIPSSPTIQWGWCLVTILLGTWAADHQARLLGVTDPSQVVIDEFAGMWLALVMLPKSLPLVCAAFVLFRGLDIAKPAPIHQLERLPGGLGIMLDDVAAGLIARALIGLGLAVAGRF